MTVKRAVIVPTYSTGCFCEKPTLYTLSGVRMEPRFNFMKAVHSCADLSGIVSIVPTSVSGKAALGVLKVPCKHFSEQVVRFDWHLDYEDYPAQARPRTDLKFTA